MATRLQVVLDEKELGEIQRAARQSRMTTAEWVRQALRAARRAADDMKTRKTMLVREAAAREFFGPDLERVLRELERGEKPWLALRGTKAVWVGDPFAPAVAPSDIEALK